MSDECYIRNLFFLPLSSLTFALNALDVQENGLGDGHIVADVLQYRDEVFQIMCIHRTNVVEAQLLEQSAAGCNASDVGVHALVHFLILVRCDY